MRGRDWKNSRVQAPLPDSGLAGALLRASQGNPQGTFGTAPRGKTDGTGSRRDEIPWKVTPCLHSAGLWCRRNGVDVLQIP